MLDETFMQLALKEAKQAALEREVPVGAVVVHGEEILSTAHNLRETGQNALHHAEVLAISEACTKLQSWRLDECDLYVTLEPCPMCAGAIINARIRRVIFGAADPKAGACGSVVNLFEQPFNHKPEWVGGVLAEEAAALLRDFFRELRRNS